MRLRSLRVLAQSGTHVTATRHTCLEGCRVLTFACNSHSAEASRGFAGGPRVTTTWSPCLEWCRGCLPVQVGSMLEGTGTGLGKFRSVRSASAVPLRRSLADKRVEPAKETDIETGVMSRVCSLYRCCVGRHPPLVRGESLGRWGSGELGSG